MKWHPGLTMVVVWMTAALAFLILPFRIETRTVTLYGFVLLAFFIATFVAGTLIATPAMPQRLTPFERRLDLSRADRLIAIVAIIAILAEFWDIANGNMLNLDSAFVTRDERAVGALRGTETGGSLAFQIGFLSYPIGFCAIAREMLYRLRIDWVRLGLLGFAPIVLAAVAMGGRGPILYAMILGFLCWRLRPTMFPELRNKVRQPLSGQKLLIIVGTVIGGLVAMNYFINVFVTRASFVGGIQHMQKISALNWGVSFDGAGSETMRGLIGEDNYYLVYVFIWYLVQGLVMSNVIFNDYTAGMTFGVYGIDLGSAIMRRINPDFVSDRFQALLDLNIYGFLPNAFGSLYVDLWFYSIIPIVLWGYFCGLVYRKFHISQDGRWALIGPFITLGLIFSLLNTPIGFGNGLVTHLWLLLLIFLIRPVNKSAATPVSR